MFANICQVQWRWYSVGVQEFIYGDSSRNQRIEAWWSILRKECSDWWICYFKDITDRGFYDENDNLHMECLRFCFKKVIRKGIDKTASQKNQQRLQVKKMQKAHLVFPTYCIFFLRQDTRKLWCSYKFQRYWCLYLNFVSNIPNEFGCNENIFQIVQLDKPNYTEPRTPDEALLLFTDLINYIKDVCTRLYDFTESTFHRIPLRIYVWPSI